MQGTKTQNTQPTKQPGRRPWAYAAAAAVIAVLGVGAFILAADRSQDISAVSAEEALAVSDTYITAFNAGDWDSMMGLLTAEAVLLEEYRPESEFGNGDPLEPIDRAFFEQHMAWATAQGSVLVSPECVVIDELPAATATVRCELGWLNAPELAAGVNPVPTNLTMVVTTDGITELASEYVPAFGVDSFDQWVVVNHSDNTAHIEYGDWDSVTEAEQGGVLRAQYVAEWSAFIEANDCTYLGVCIASDQ